MVAPTRVYMGGTYSCRGQGGCGGSTKGSGNTKYCSDVLIGGPTHLKWVSCNCVRLAFLARAHLSVPDTRVYGVHIPPQGEGREVGGVYGGVGGHVILFRWANGWSNTHLAGFL